MPSPLSELLGEDELRGQGMDLLKQRMLMQLLLQNPVAEGDADPTSPFYTGDGSSRPESRINRYMPGSSDPGAVFHPDGPSRAPQVVRDSAEAPVIAGRENNDSDDQGLDIYKLLSLLKGRQAVG